MMSGSRILVVEDEGIIALEIAQSLRDLGYVVAGTADDCDGAVALALAERPDLVLMDVMLKGEDDGVEAARRIRAERDVPVVFLTAYSDSETLARAKEVAPYGFLVKPFRADELRAALDVAFAKHVMATRLRASEVRFRGAFADAPIGMALLDAGGRITLANEALCRLTNATTDVLQGRLFTSLISSADSARIATLLASARAGQAGAAQVELICDAREEVMCAIVSVAALSAASTDAEAFVAHVQDVTARQRAEAELARHRDRLEELVAARTAELAEREHLLREAQRIGKMGHWTVDLASGALCWSDEIYRIFGRIREEFDLNQAAFYEAVHPDDRERVKAAEMSALRTGALEIDHRIVLPDGGVRWVHERARVVRDGNGTALQLVGTVQDITERKVIEQRLLEAKEAADRANRAKSEFLSRISHELRTPMNSILGFAQLLDMDDGLSATQRERVGEIRVAGAHLLALIDDLLDLSRIEAGKLTVDLRAVRVSDAVQQAVDMVETVAHQFDVRIQADVPPDLAAHADATRLRQILVNLLSNACKYNVRGGSVAVSCERRSPGTLVLAVADTGPGLTPEQVARLFTPFERVGAERSGVEGVGIGLALSKRLADLMAMRLEVTSSRGRGSVFTLTMGEARSEAPRNGAERTSVCAPVSPIGTVLYIEDNPANLRLVEAVFRIHFDASLATAPEGQQGLALARQLRPSLILLDINLPDIDGYEVLARLRADAATASIPVVALSANAMPADIERGQRAGFLRYLTKPLRIEDLNALLRDLAGAVVS
jgi:PAS domain S-box-containing protein